MLRTFRRSGSWVLGGLLLVSGCGEEADSSPRNDGASGGSGAATPAPTAGQGNGGAGGAAPTPTASNGGTGGLRAPMGAAGGGAGNPGAGGVGGAGEGPGGAATGGSDMGPPLGECDLVCDDFEGASFDLTKWNFLGNGESNAMMTPVLDATKAHSGQNSITIPGGLTRGIGFYPQTGLPAPDNAFFVRSYVLFETATRDLSGHSAFIIAADQPNNGGEVRVGLSQPPGNDSVMLDVNIQNVQDIGGEITQFSNGYVTGFEPLPDSGTTFEADQWYCVEVYFNGKDHEIQLWIDGEEIPNMHVTDWSPKDQETKLTKRNWSPPYNAVRFGPQNYSGSPGKIWFDDIAVSTQRVGCAL